MNVDLPAINILSLCAGIGGIDLGLSLAISGARTVCFVENEATVIEKLVARMEDGAVHPAPVWTDLKTFNGRPWRGVVDILTAGYPCQPFSCAGKQRGEADPRHLWPHVARIIREAEPGIVFLENVENHLRIGYDQVRRELHRLGYQTEEGIFSAEEVGAPHLRKRLFVLAHSEERGCGVLRESSGIERFPNSSDAELENAARPERNGQDREDGGRRRRIRKTGDGVADAGDGFLPIARRREEERARSRSAGEELADTPSAQRARRAGREYESAGKQEQRSRAGGRIFPPGPDDLDGWRDLLAHDPTLEPALCGTPDGASSRVDRLRACGNGVVPLVAGFAFASLARAAGLTQIARNEPAAD